MKSLIVILCLLTPSFSLATLSIPSGLSDAEQELVLQILGFGTSFRPVNNPYPLGGYSGLELGVAFSNLPTGDVGYFGQQAPVDRSVIYPQIALGKGIFDSIDLLFNFIPYTEATGVGEYSAGLRWGFFQATFLPTCFSLLLHGSTSNFSNVIISQTAGVDLITGVNVDPISFYLGAGIIYGQSLFDKSITASGFNKMQTGRSLHTILGLNLALGEAFMAIELDTYSTTVTSAKLGLRF